MKSQWLTSSAPKKDDPNNPFTQYNTDIRKAVGQETGDYFDQVLSGTSRKTDLLSINLPRE